MSDFLLFAKAGVWMVLFFLWLVLIAPASLFTIGFGFSAGKLVGAMCLIGSLIPPALLCGVFHLFFLRGLSKQTQSRVSRPRPLHAVTPKP